MSIPATPNNVLVQSANQQILVSWDQTAGATSYVVQRSLDNVTFTTVATISGSPLATQYLDASPLLGVTYWYRVASNNGTNSAFSTAQSAVAVPTGEMCLSQIRLASQEKADRVNSQFVTTTEWNSFINRAMFELYDLLITVYEEYFIATPIQFVSDGVTFLYPLPNGSNTFLNALDLNQTITPPAYYKLSGVDLALQNVNNAYVTIGKFNFASRNQFIYPNSSSSLYGVFNLQYRIMGNNLFFIPTPSAGQAIRVWYIPRLKQLLQDTDITVTGISQWNEYIITRAAGYALSKEESDTARLDQELLLLKSRIEESASNRDASQPDTISEVRQFGGWGRGPNGGWNGSTGGF